MLAKRRTDQRTMVRASQASIVKLRNKAGLLLVALVLSGCSALSNTTPVVLYMAIETGFISTDNRKDTDSDVKRIVSKFQKLHPNVQVQFSLYESSNLISELRKRSLFGLGPDLIVTGASMARELLREGLTDPLPESQRTKEQTDPTYLEWVRSQDGRLAGQPLFVLPQIACFNSQAIQQPPESLNDLLKVGAAGARVGLSMNMFEVLWTAGSLNALPALVAASRGTPLVPEQRDRIAAWLTWLQQASNQRNLNFVNNDTQLATLLGNRELDWISCNPSSLARLRDQLGDDLDISALPNGPHNASAAPFNVPVVMALGQDSSAEQRSMAIKLGDYITNPLVQRQDFLLPMSYLPVNPNVIIPTKSSKRLAAIAQARHQFQEHSSDLAALYARGLLFGQLSDVLTQVVSGVSQPDTSTDELISILSQKR